MNRSREHFVQFYESDSFLIESVSDFIRAGLEDGEVGIVIATEEHRRGIEDRLKGVAPDAFRERYVALDAAQTLRKFMADGSPDPARFRDVIGSLMERMSKSGRRMQIGRASCRG